LVSEPLFAEQDLVDSSPLAALAFGLAMLALAWAWWVYFPRYEAVLRRIPGALGRLPTTLFFVVVGGFITVSAVISAVS
jgi:hypothetical protein